MFDWNDYLDFSERLLASDPDDEACQRSAISRSYYAMFNTAKALLISEGVAIPPTGAAHEMVWQAMQQAPRGVRRRIAQAGFRVRRRRDLADYEADYPMVTVDATRCVEWSKRAIRDALDERDGLP